MFYANMQKLAYLTASKRFGGISVTFTLYL